MKVLTGFSMRCGGRSYTLLHTLEDDKATAKLATYMGKASGGLSKKKPEIAAKLLLEQFPALAAVEVRAGTITTKVFR
jgi:hypothetical protein